MRNQTKLFVAAATTVLGVAMIGCENAGLDRGPNQPGAEMKLQQSKVAESNTTMEGRYGQNPPAPGTPYTAPGAASPVLINPQAADQVGVENAHTDIIRSTG